MTAGSSNGRLVGTATTRAPLVEIVSIRPEPDPGVRRAIEEAVNQVWPRARPEPVDKAPPWRFSGRWWAQPAAMRRDRPNAVG